MPRMRPHFFPNCDPVEVPPRFADAREMIADAIIAIWAVSAALGRTLRRAAMHGFPTNVKGW